MLQHLARLRLGAGGGEAGILAAAVQAGQRRRARVVAVAGGGRRHGAAELAGEVDGQLVLAGADGAVGLHDALLVGAAPASDAGVPAGAALDVAELGDVTLCVGGAAPPGGGDGRNGADAVELGPAAPVRAADEALWALAAWAVLDHFAERVLAARGAPAARVDARAVDASLVYRALAIVRAA